MHKRIALFFLTTFIILFYALIGHYGFSYSESYPMDTLSTGWLVTYHNNNYVNAMPANLDRYLGPNLRKGDVVVLTHALSREYSKIPFLTLFFKTSYSVFEVYIDGELIDNESLTEYSSSGFIGKGYHFILMGDTAKKGNVSIVFHVAEEDTPSILAPPIIGNYDDILHYFINRSTFPFFTAIFLIIFGLSFFVISLMFLPFSGNSLPQIPVSFLTFLTGVWTLCSYGMSSLLMDNKFTTLMEYLSLYLIVPTIYIIVYLLHKNSISKAYITISIGISSLSFIFILMHLFEIVHLHHFLNAYLLMALISYVILIYIYVRDLKSKMAQPSVLILMTGLIILCTAMITYGIYLAFVDITDFSFIPILNNAFPIGAIIFAITQLVNYFVFMTHSLAKRKEYVSLSQLAFFDALTGLSNRASCDRELEMIDKTDKDYCILSLDMNGLKEVNDNAGHPEGDKLLKSFSGVLKKVFGQIKGSQCFRVGGDEFLVLIDNISDAEVKQSIFNINSELLLLDDIEPDYSHSTAIGYAFRHETEAKTSHAVYMLADARMYEHKRSQHSKKQGL